MGTQRGFSTIDVLFTVFLVGVLAVVVAFTLDVMKKRAADSKRVSDIYALQQKLEDYYDEYAEYPGQLEDLVTSGFLPYLPTPAPYGETRRFYSYVPLGENGICTGYHIGTILETNFDGYVDKDMDAPAGVACFSASGKDFHGAALNCEALGKVDVAKDNCYDVRI